MTCHSPLIYNQTPEDKRAPLASLLEECRKNIFAMATVLPDDSDLAKNESETIDTLNKLEELMGFRTAPQEVTCHMYQMCMHDVVMLCVMMTFCFSKNVNGFASAPIVSAAEPHDVSSHPQMYIHHPPSHLHSDYRNSDENSRPPRSSSRPRRKSPNHSSTHSKDKSKTPTASPHSSKATARNPDSLSNTVASSTISPETSASPRRNGQRTAAPSSAQRRWPI